MTSRGGPAPWRPTAFGAYRDHFPATPAPPLHEDVSAAFEAWWNAEDRRDAALRRRLSGALVVLGRGFLGHWMPGNFLGVRSKFRRLGIRCEIAPNRTGGGIEENAARIGTWLDRVAPTEPLLLIGHSKAGLELLQLLATRPDLARRTVGLLTVQTTRGASCVLDSVLAGRHAETLTNARRRAGERVMARSLSLIGAAGGGRALTTGRIEPVIERLDAYRPPCPVLQVATWSVRPSSFLDSFHTRLAEIRPGVAHDGQFHLDQLVWPGRRHVLLAHIDHDQPAMGGLGFDAARAMTSLVPTLLEEPIP